MYYLPPTLISILEVLLVIVPALLCVAYVTVAERKTMASMQRRLGPNAVGYLPRFSLSRIGSFKNYFHTSTIDKLINGLYLTRKAPIKPFKDDVIKTCKDLLSPSNLKIFFQKY
jgi:NADH:ubiquinone oxidoreductase subunit H